MTRVFFLAIVTAGAMMAQTHGYAFVAPGVVSYGSNLETPANKGTSGLIHLGFGGEYVFKDIIGAGAEIGFLGRTDLGALGATSINGYYHCGTGPGRRSSPPGIRTSSSCSTPTALRTLAAA